VTLLLIKKDKTIPVEATVFYNTSRRIIARETSGANFTNQGDFVGEGLRGNSGVNGEASILDRINLFNAIKLMTPSSPHGGYDPYKFVELKDVTGYKK